MHNGRGIEMKRGLMGAAIAAVCVAAPAGASTVEPELSRELAAATAGAEVTAIVTASRADDRRTARRLHRSGLQVIRFKNLPLLAVRGTAAELRAAAGVRGVRRLSANSVIKPTLAQSRDFIGATSVQQDLGVTGKGVGVAVIDTGVDEEHPDLAPALKENVYVLRESDMWTLVADRPQQIPDAGTIVLPSRRDVDGGHGTGVASIVAGRGTASGGRNRGIAPGSDLIGIGVGATPAHVMISTIAAMDYAIEHKKRLNIQVVNNSWAKAHAEPVFTYDAEDPVNVASKALYAAGIAVVFGGGNDGPAEDTMNTYAVWPWVLAVGAGCVPGKPTYSNCSLANLSSRGVQGDPLLHPDVIAPGFGIVSARAAVPNPLSAFEEELQGLCGQGDPLADFRWYRCSSGTSLAAPHVAGTMALLEEAAGCDLTPDQLYALVTSTATPMPAYKEFEVGSGFLDARAAVDRVRAERDTLCPKKDKPGRDAKPPKSGKEQPAKARAAAIALEPRPTATSRTVRVGLRPSTRLRDVRIVVRRGGRVVAASRLARLDRHRTLKLRTRSTLRRGALTVTVTALNPAGRRVTARDRFTR